MDKYQFNHMIDIINTILTRGDMFNPHNVLESAFRIDDFFNKYKLEINIISDYTHEHYHNMHLHIDNFHGGTYPVTLSINFEELEYSEFVFGNINIDDKKSIHFEFVPELYKDIDIANSNSLCDFLKCIIKNEFIEYLYLIYRDAIWQSASSNYKRYKRFYDNIRSAKKDYINIYKMLLNHNIITTNDIYNELSRYAEVRKIKNHICVMPYDAGKSAYTNGLFRLFIK